MAKEPAETAELERLRARAAALEAQLASLAGKNTPPADDSRPPSNRAHKSLPSTGDKPGR